MPHTEFNKLSEYSDPEGEFHGVLNYRTSRWQLFASKTVTLLHWMDFTCHQGRRKVMDWFVLSLKLLSLFFFCHFVLLGNGHRENQISPLSSTTVDVRRDRFTARRAQKDYPRGEKGSWSEASNTLRREDSLGALW